MDSVVGRPPIVGESTIEIPIMMMHWLGLGEILETSHFPKHGLTFYYKHAASEASERRYWVFEPPGEVYHLSYQLNRERFDEQLRTRNLAEGVRMVEGKVRTAHAHASGEHVLEVTGADGAQSLRADWLIDASGRKGVVAKPRGWRKPVDPAEQRSAFWVHLADFDPERLAAIEALKPGQEIYDSYRVTHHFMGRGHWVWCIPLASDEHANLMSLGVTWHPGFADPSIRSIEQLRQFLAREHPALAELLDSGACLDHAAYRNYRYVPLRAYGADRTYVIGDAAAAPDPLYSTGIATTCVQITQVAELIARDAQGRSIAAITRDYDALICAGIELSQNEISAAYASMHSALPAAARMQWLMASYFHLMLPAWINGLHLHWLVARLARWSMPLVRWIAAFDRRHSESLFCAAAKTAATVPYAHHHMAPERYDCGVLGLPWHLGTLLRARTFLRAFALRRAGLRYVWPHLPWLALEWSLGLSLRAVGYLGLTLSTRDPATRYARDIRA